MTQINLHVTAEFEKELEQLMKVKQLKTKTLAIRIAVKECLEHAIAAQKIPSDFSHWIGLGNQATMNEKPRFESDDDLWK